MEHFRTHVPNHQAVWHDSGLLPLKLQETAISHVARKPRAWMMNSSHVADDQLD